MPTLIDSFIVELGLDSKGFTRGQAQVAQNLRSLENQAEAGAARVAQKTQSGLQALLGILKQQSTAAAQQTTSAIQASQTQATALNNLLGNLQKQFQATNQGLTATGLNARRSGHSIRAGAQAGAYGLKELATAGLAAYTTLKTVQNMILSTQQVARDTMRTGQLAAAANMPVGRFSARALAASETVGANPREIEQELAQLQQDLTSSRLRGEWQGRLTNIGMAGVPINLTDSVEQILAKVSAKVQGMRPDEQLNWLMSQGFGPSHAQFLRMAPGQQQAAIDQAGRRAVTEDQVKNLSSLDNQIQKVINAYESLQREILSRYSKGGLASALEGFAELITKAKENETALSVLEKAYGVGFVGALAAAGAAIGRFAQVLLGLSTNPGLVALTGLARVMSPFAVLWGAWQGLGGGGNIPADENKLPGANQDVEKNFRQGARPAPPGAKARPDDGPVTRWWKNATAPWRKSDGPAAEAMVPQGQVTGSADPSVIQGINFFMGKGLTREQATGFVSRLAHESGGGTKLDPNAFNPAGGGKGAYGIAQARGDRQDIYRRAGGSLQGQLEAVWTELTTTEKRALDAIRATTTPESAATAAEVFARAGDPAFTAKAAGGARGIFDKLNPVSPAGAALPPAGAALPLAGAALQYANQGAIRRFKVTESLENRMKEVAETLYGPGSRVVVGSGGQHASGVEGRDRTGSHRHDVDASGRGRAADVKFYDPHGNQVTGEALSRVGQYWRAKDYGGVGLRMHGDSIHLDEHKDRARSWFYEGATGADREAIAAGARGVMPSTAAAQAVRASRWSGSPVNSNMSTYNNEANIGQVVVNTQATDANGIAGAISGAIQRNMAVTDANQGLEY